MDGLVERCQLLFLNPDLTGLFSALLATRAGAKVAVVDEHKKWKTEEEGRLPAFPFDGTMHPAAAEAQVGNAGLPAVKWHKESTIDLKVANKQLTLNADSGTGGFTLALLELFPHHKMLVAEWLQTQATRARELISVNGNRRLPQGKSVSTSVLEAVTELGVPPSSPFLTLLDTLCWLSQGRGMAQTDTRDFHLVIASLLGGWHRPVMEHTSWPELLLSELVRSGAKYHQTEPVAAVQAIGRRFTGVKGADGTLLVGQLLVVPETDRFLHPLAGPVGTVRWCWWRGSLRDKPEHASCAGLIRGDGNRPPLNDNFVSWLIQNGADIRFVAAAPVEPRYLAEDKLNMLGSRIRNLLSQHLGWQIESFNGPRLQAQEPKITLPGVAPVVSYAEGPLLGDDLGSRLESGESLCRQILRALARNGS